MITFKFPEEKIYLNLLANKINSPFVLQLLGGEQVHSSEEAINLAKLFWTIVDKSIELENSGELDEFPEGAEYWNEKIMYSISGYLERLGYEDEWDRVTDEQQRRTKPSHKLIFPDAYPSQPSRSEQPTLQALQTMITFDEYDQPAKTITLHYANRLNNDLATKVISGNADISSKEEVEQLAYFFWTMVDEAVEDEENNIAIEGYSDLQSWLEKAMHIFSGYIKKHGFADQWRDVSRKCG